jgi:hypothetical protein
MSGGFRTNDGIQMFCDIMSVIRTIKRRGMNIFQSISLNIERGVLRRYVIT